MFDQEDRDASILDGADQADEVMGFLVVHASGRLVEYDELGLGGKGAGDFEESLIAVRTGFWPCSAIHGTGPTKSSSAMAWRMDSCSSRRWVGVRNMAASEPECMRQWRAREHVFKDAHVLKQSNGLEGAGYAPFHDVCGWAGRQGSGRQRGQCRCWGW